MNKKFFTTKRILYVLVSLFTFIYALFEINYEQSILAIIMTILIGLFLTQWYLFVGLIKSRDNNKIVGDDNKDEDKDSGEKKEEGELHFFNQKGDGSLLPRWQVLTLSATLSIYVISLGFLSDENFDFVPRSETIMIRTFWAVCD